MVGKEEIIYAELTTCNSDKKALGEMFNAYIEKKSNEMIINEIERVLNDKKVEKKYQRIEGIYGTYHRTSIVLVNKDYYESMKRELVESGKKIGELEEKLKAYSDIGIGDVIEMVRKAEVMKKFAQDMAELGEEFNREMED